MKFLKLFLSAFALVFLQFQSADAISITEDTTQVDDSSNAREFDFALEYGTTRVYRGIKSSTNPYLSPSFTYSAVSGFFTGIRSYVPLDSGNIDETDISAGFSFINSRNTEVSLELIHYIFKNEQLANSQIKNGLELYFRHDFGSVYSTKIYADADFGKGTTDFSFTLDNAFEFDLGSVFVEDSRMAFKPSFSLTAGSTNLVRKVKNEILSTGFRLTNYDLSLSLEYDIGNFIIEPSFSYDIPAEQKFPLLKKTIKSDPVSYFTATITYVLQ